MSRLPTMDSCVNACAARSSCAVLSLRFASRSSASTVVKFMFTMGSMKLLRKYAVRLSDASAVLRRCDWRLYVVGVV
jgi:hypothetical protein